MARRRTIVFLCLLLSLHQLNAFRVYEKTSRPDVRNDVLGYFRRVVRGDIINDVRREQKTVRKGDEANDSKSDTKGDDRRDLMSDIREGKPFYYQDEDGRIMEVRRTGLKYPPVKRQCECYCLVAGDETTIHCCVECHVTESVCFPASAYVRGKHDDVIKMKDLKIGDTILTASESAQIQETEVIGFLTYDTEVIGGYRKLSLETGDYLLLSRSHVLFVSDNITQQATSRFAADVAVGQYLLLRNGRDVTPTRVTSIRVEAHQGAYVPLTSHGTLLVNDVKVSSYAAFPHDVAHGFLFPLRWFPFLASYTSPSNGDSSYVTFMKAFGDLIMPASRYAVGQSRTNGQVPDLSPTDITQYPLPEIL